MPKSADAGTTPTIVLGRSLSRRVRPTIARIALELPLPHCLADEHDAAAAGLVFFRREHSSHRWRDTEHRQESIGHVQCRHTRWIAVLQIEVGLAGNERGEVSDATASLSEIEKIREVTPVRASYRSLDRFPRS